MTPPLLYAIIDFEATCEKDGTMYNPIQNQEIIEFPMILMNEDGKVIEEYHNYVKPIFNPVLTEFCTNLTGITQDKVEFASPFEIVWKKVSIILSAYNVEYNIIPIAHGDWDFKIMLPKQLALISQKLPSMFKQWCNIKKIYEKHTRQKCKSIPKALEQIGMKFEGRLHSGIDDTRNIARIVKYLIENGSPPKITSQL